MTTRKKKSAARSFLEELRGGPLTFGQMIKSLRLADEIAQVELAHRMEISRAHLCDIEQGRRTVSVERAAQFAKVMGYSETQFVAVALDDQLREAGVHARVELLKVA
jgi:transcriptional regulator with XRE-family HTH domain